MLWCFSVQDGVIDGIHRLLFDSSYFLCGIVSAVSTHETYRSLQYTLGTTNSPRVPVVEQYNSPRQYSDHTIFEWVRKNSDIILPSRISTHPHIPNALIPSPIATLPPSSLQTLFLDLSPLLLSLLHHLLSLLCSSNPLHVLLDFLSASCVFLGCGFGVVGPDVVVFLGVGGTSVDYQRWDGG